MRQIKKRTSIFSFFLIVCISLLIPSPLLACGMALSIDPTTHQFDYASESDHQVFINYSKGIQKMIVAANLEETEGRSIVWLFPLPADPNQVSVDILNTIPQLSGEDIKISAKKNIKEISSWLKYTQLYPFIIENFLGTNQILSIPAESKGTFGALPLTGGASSVPDVLLFKHLEKEGVTAEVLTAKTSNGLYDYLKNKGLDIAVGAIPTMDTYIGKDYSFLALWITNTTPSSLNTGTKGFYVSFPTNKIYYPLLPETVYKDMYMPMTIRVLGYVGSHVYQTIQPVTRVSYYVDSQSTQDPALSEFFDSKMTNIQYTKFEIDATADMYTEDLWIDSHPAPSVNLAWFMTTHKILSGIVLAVFLSVFTGIITGFIVFKEFRNKTGLWKFGLVGLGNCVTILGVITALAITQTQYLQNPDGTIPPRFQQLKDGRKVVYCISYSILFLIFLWITESILHSIL